ncbi:ribosome maturation factor RimM [Thiosulfativibrio zosterae]|uniref:Ribosome maturation factor RimM n=1 Tax=Thiosulfativibrio zosterae TaxID=2675053 RepID=A0A6F8PPU4_9GAMM|nr:ribosome maturation factor RimM [Thiosulfativibrio zosterae]BBP44058.1 ribosome maturation factor RimM [Thiosulfativibrio zosterae]
MKDERIIVGQINGVFGVKGWVKVFSHTEPRDNIINYSPWWLNIQGEWKPFDVLDGQTQQGGKAVVALLKGIEDREVARSFMGAQISITPDQLDALRDDDVYYWRDLMGCEVINQDDVLLGTVTELVETGAHDVLRVVDQAQSTTILIPYVFDVYIEEISLEDKRIYVHWDLEEEVDETNQEG